MWLPRFLRVPPTQPGWRTRVTRRVPSLLPGWDRIRRFGVRIRPPDPSFYGERYFGAGAGKAHSGSGYGAFDAETSNSRLLAATLKRHFSPCRLLDVGTAMGWFVDAIRKEGFDARGCDGSAAATGRALPHIAPHLFQFDLARDEWRGDSYEIVTAFEVLEHLDPSSVPRALRTLRNIQPKFLIATIPSFGPNGDAPAGWLDGKVAWDRIAHYRALGPEYDGPVPFEDLAFDAEGFPIEGHLTIASYAWWTRQFAAAGFTRDREREAALLQDFTAAGKAGLWNLYVLVPAPQS